MFRLTAVCDSHIANFTVRLTVNPVIADGLRSPHAKAGCTLRFLQRATSCSSLLNLSDCSASCTMTRWICCCTSLPSFWSCSQTAVSFPSAAASECTSPAVGCGCVGSGGFAGACCARCWVLLAISWRMMGLCTACKAFPKAALRASRSFCEDKSQVRATPEPCQPCI